MTGKVVNLNRARKTRVREAQKARATENTARFGRSKAERAAQDLRDEKARRDLDGHEVE